MIRVEYNFLFFKPALEFIVLYLFKLLFFHSINYVLLFSLIFEQNSLNKFYLIPLMNIQI